MEESPSGKHSRGSTRRKDQDTPVDDNVDPVKCTGKRCQSCIGGVIADCIAVCCCPCAVLSCFTLAFLKAPYLMGKRCLGLRKKKEKSRKCERDSNRGVDANLENHGLEMESLEIGYVCEEEDKEESERVWMELYQLGHLGFGRVSFTGVQLQGKELFSGELILHISAPTSLLQRVVGPTVNTCPHSLSAEAVER